MPTTNEHHLVISATCLKAVLDQTTGNLLEVRHRTDLHRGNSILEVDGLGTAVNSDRPFHFTLSNAQRARLQNLLGAAGDQPVTIRFILSTSKLEVSNILI